MGWPQQHWYALADGALVPQTLGGSARLEVVDLGLLHLPTGALGACDAFVAFEHPMVVAHVKPGAYPVRLTRGDVRLRPDEPEHVRECYLTVLLDPDATEVRREEFDGAIGVDAGTVGFLDAGLMPGAADALDEEAMLGPGGWLRQLEDPKNLTENAASLVFPGHEPANLVASGSGWGDGIYAVVLGYDASDALVAVHIDLDVVGEYQPPPPPAPSHEDPPKRRGLTMVLMFVPMALWFTAGLLLEWPVEWVGLPVTGIALGVGLFANLKGWT